MGWLCSTVSTALRLPPIGCFPLWPPDGVFLYGSVFGQSSGVCHWAHIGGFVFGGLIAVESTRIGLEQIAEKGIQEKITWVSHPLLAQAMND